MAGGPLAELGHAAEPGPGHHGCPRKRRAPWVNDPHRRADQRQPGTQVRRHHLRARRQLVPEESGVDRTLGRAPGEVQHAGVKDSHLIVFGQAHRLRRPQREQRGAQPVLQRLAHGQVGHQRQHCRGFGQPQRAEGHRHPHHAGRRGSRGRCRPRETQAQHTGRGSCPPKSRTATPSRCPRAAFRLRHGSTLPLDAAQVLAAESMLRSSASLRAIAACSAPTSRLRVSSR